MSIEPAYRINGVIDTAKPVLDNINEIAAAASAWFTWDADAGTWSVVLNREVRVADETVFQFSDANIIGGVQLSGSGVNEQYNAVTIAFPHRDLRDHTDYVDLSIDSAELLPNELENRLNLRFELINDPVIAQQIATQELKQSRLDRVIRFTTDYTANGIKAGDIVTVQNTPLTGAGAFPYRVTEIVERDTDDGGMVFEITALEFSNDIYDTDLVFEERNKKTGIIPKDQNETIIQADQAALGFDLASLLGLAGPALNALLSAFKDNDIIQTRIATGFISTASLDSFFTTLGNPSGPGQDYANASGYRNANAINSPLSITYTAPADGFAFVDWNNPIADCLANVDSGATRFEAVTIPMYVLEVQNGDQGFLKPLTDTQNWITFNQGDVITWYFVPYWYHEWSLGSNSRVVFYDPDFYTLVSNDTASIIMNINAFFTEKQNL